MRTWIHCYGAGVQYRYEPDDGKVLARTWLQSDDTTLEMCFHCDQARRVEGKLDSEIPHDAAKCDVCGATTMPHEGEFDSNPIPTT